MYYQIQNDYLSAKISDEGGELVSLKNAIGDELLWQGDPAYWKKQAPHLFPYVGRLTDGQYRYLGKTYKMDTHGFFRYQKMTCSENNDLQVVMEMESCNDTRIQYPFDWIVTLKHTLLKNALHIEFTVKNLDHQDLYFAYGGHPGFITPFSKGSNFEDYEIQFEKSVRPMQIHLSDACFVEEGETPLSLNENHALALKHCLFDRDAIILKNPGKQVSLFDKNTGRSITVSFAGLPYLGLWHTPKTEAPFVCIEPWSSLPSRHQIIESIEKKEDMIHLTPNDIWRIEWVIRYQ